MRVIFARAILAYIRMHFSILARPGSAPHKLASVKSHLERLLPDQSADARSLDLRFLFDQGDLKRLNMDLPRPMDVSGILHLDFNMGNKNGRLSGLEFVWGRR